MTADGSREPESKSVDARFDALVESYLDAIRRGQQPSIEEYAESHPDLATRIEAVFPTLQAIERAPTGTATIGRLGEFRILREIGRGGMGVVYEAEQESLGRRVALKVLPPGFVGEERRLERFRREARAAASLTHPSIVPVYGVGEADGHHFFVMQYIPGHGLDAVIAALRRIRESGSWPGSGGGPLPAASPSSAESSALEMLGVTSADPCGSGALYFRSVARLGAQAARAIASAHAQGILHRDIKPSNLLIAGGHLWVADFGLAKAEGVEDLTRSGEVVGSLRYMAPERFSGEATPQSDIYSLGLTLYELVALKPAFDDNERAHLLRRMLDGDLEPLRPRIPDVPLTLESVVLRAAAKLREERYSSAGQLAEDLERFMGEAPLMASPARRRPWLRRLRGWPGVSATAAAAIVLGVVAAIYSSRTPEISHATRPDAPTVEYSVVAPDMTERRLRLFPLAADNSWGVALADMDRDGDTDIVVVSKGVPDHVTVLRNQRQRSFTDTGDHPSVGKFPLDVLAADLDGDAYSDVATVNKDSLDISVLRGNVDGKLTTANALPLGSAGFSLAGGDLDGDGDLDLVAARKPNVLRIFKNEGGLFLDHVDIEVGNGPTGLLASDLDADGRTDLALALEIGDCVVVLRQEQGGRLSVPVKYPCGDQPTDVASGDLDGDANPDLVVACHKRGSIAFLQNRGPGDFYPAAQLNGPQGLFSVVVADVNGDGIPDVAANNEHDGSISVILNNKGGGRFRRGVEFPTHGQPFRLAVADLDGDGKPDVVATNGGTGTVAILFGE